MAFQRTWLLGFAIICLLVGACAKTSNSPAPASLDPRELAKNDIKSFATLNETGPRLYDEDHGHAFSAVFGGTSGSAVNEFMSTRIHYFVTKDELVGLSPKKDAYPGWQTDEKDDDNGPAPGNKPEKPKAKGEIAAANIGMALWFKGLVNRMPYTLILKSKEILLASPRLGVMLFGPGYRAGVQAAPSERYPEGHYYTFPPEYRQKTLLHEARHSDCTGGVTEAELEMIRHMKNHREFNDTFKNRQCGHMHVLCPEGHELAGLSACDRAPWGAYTVGAIYSTAVSHTMTGTDRRIMEASAIDAWSRVLIDKDAMLAGAFGPPNMSSEGPK